ncbi:hypothetical protein F5884DRAFT_394157 [Xylogone sp. PMI_703]|nr:hypothetical protein F5884DRAFT_394157 [Xylogone sp. PMI_703]
MEFRSCPVTVHSRSKFVPSLLDRIVHSLTDKSNRLMTRNNGLVCLDHRRASRRKSHCRSGQPQARWEKASFSASCGLSLYRRQLPPKDDANSQRLFCRTAFKNRRQPHPMYWLKAVYSIIPYSTTSVAFLFSILLLSVHPLSELHRNLFLFLFAVIARSLRTRKPQDLRFSKRSFVRTCPLVGHESDPLKISPFTPTS